MPMTAKAIINDLGLMPHPEGSWYRALYRSSIAVTGPKGTRTALTPIYHLPEHADHFGPTMSHLRDLL